MATLVASLVALVGSRAVVLAAGPIGPQFFGGARAVRDRCELLASTRPSRPPPVPTDVVPVAADTAACLDLVRDALLAPATATLDSIQHEVPGLSRQGARRRQLLGTYRAIRQLEAWTVWIARQGGGSSIAAERLAIERDVLAALDGQGLVGAGYTVVAQGGVEAADPGGYLGEPAGAPHPGSTSGIARLDVETEHVGLGRGWEIALGFDVGRQPILVMVKQAAGASVTAAYVAGLTTSTGFRFAHASTSTETALVGRVGATRLGSGRPRLGSGVGSAPALVAVNDVTDWALFFDGLVDFRWYARDVWLVHLAAQPLDPLFHIYGGVKHDQRFHRSGDLADFEDPSGRVLFGFGVNPVRLADARTDGSGDTWLTVGGGFEFEGALRETHRLPSGVRLTLSASVDVLKAWPRRHDRP
jgi:hypothetical protein